jgi:glutamate carboxypeptidase
MQAIDEIKSSLINQKEMIEDLVALCNINSYSYNVTGVNEVGNILVDKFKNIFQEKISIEKKILEDDQILNSQGDFINKKLGDLIFIKKEIVNAQYKILLMGHLDTVFSEESDFQTCTEIDDNTINGPGVADLKGGLLVMLKALEIFENSRFADEISWTVCLNPDEEVGSPQSQNHFAKLAQEHDFGLIFEPSLADGSIAWRRKGTGNFHVLAQGKAAHVGREFSKGQNAIYALAEFMLEANKLNNKEENIIVNFGKINGGGALNVVADQASLSINIRTHSLADEKIALDKFKEIITDLNKKENLKLELVGKLNRKPKIPNEKMQKLFTAYQKCAQELEQNFSKRDTGGCCDGNNLFEFGLANLDCMGVLGGKIHSSDEFICLDSLSQRSLLNALFLMKLASGELEV